MFRRKPSADDGLFRVGDRVTVTDGYDGSESRWLRGGPGHSGTITAIDGPKAIVELDDELILDGGTWQDFGTGSTSAIGSVATAHGRWLVLMQGWVGGSWNVPLKPLQVGLCPLRPDLPSIPPGGGIGFWIESHATMLSAAT